MTEDIQSVRVIHTDGKDPVFVNLCVLLDESLDELVGGAVQREQYVPFNKLDDIHNAVILYLGDEPVASGAFRHYQEDCAEIKRVFVKPSHRGRGLSRILMDELESRAWREGYRRLILETGAPLIAAGHLYRNIGFRRIENYGPYAGMEESVCMEKELDREKQEIQERE